MFYEASWNSPSAFWMVQNRPFLCVTHATAYFWVLGQWRSQPVIFRGARANNRGARITDQSGPFFFKFVNFVVVFFLNSTNTIYKHKKEKKVYKKSLYIRWLKNASTFDGLKRKAFLYVKMSILREFTWNYVIWRKMCFFSPHRQASRFVLLLDR